MGHRAIVSPLSTIRALAWELPPGAFDAVLLTSARALTQCAALAALTSLPAYTVGNVTAESARAAGYRDVRPGAGGGAQQVLDALAPPCRLLWLAGADRTALVPPHGVTLTIVETYAADPTPLDAAALAELRAGAVDWALLYSTRAVALFARELERAGVARGAVAIAAISPAALAATPDGWRAAVAAAAPTEAALLLAAGL